jgi:hypothetical protein
MADKTNAVHSKGYVWFMRSVCMATDDLSWVLYTGSCNGEVKVRIFTIKGNTIHAYAKDSCKDKIQDTHAHLSADMLHYLHSYYT